LAKHVWAAHGEGERFACGSCEALFGTEGDRRIHEEGVHEAKTNQERKFGERNAAPECGVCGELFKDALTLRWHMVVEHEFGKSNVAGAGEKLEGSSGNANAGNLDEARESLLSGSVNDVTRVDDDPGSAPPENLTSQSEGPVERAENQAQSGGGTTAGHSCDHCGEWCTDDLTLRWHVVVKHEIARGKFRAPPPSSSPA